MLTAVIENTSHNRVILVISNFMALWYNIGVIILGLDLFSMGVIWKLRTYLIGLRSSVTFILSGGI